MSKLVTLSADETEATVTDAEVGDILSTVFSSNQAVTGTYGLIQKVGLVTVGMGINSYRLRGTFNPYVAA